VISLPVHPAADLFPMMSTEELQELGATIVADGQEYPIMLSHDGKQLIDGRNRLAACKLVNVEPVFARLAPDRDVDAYIVKVNLSRRNVTKGQQAMLLALIYPEAHSKKCKETLPFSKMRLAQARSVLHYSRPLALAVAAGTSPLDQALLTVKQAEQYQSSDEAKLTRLRESAPDLAEQVSEERLKINEAIAALTAREQELRDIADRGHRAAETVGAHYLGAALAIFQAHKSGEHIEISADVMQQIDEGNTLMSRMNNRKRLNAG
jgi:hypothetical protein